MRPAHKCAERKVCYSAYPAAMLEITAIDGGK
jgi:hypothetical protein